MRPRGLTQLWERQTHELKHAQQLLDRRVGARSELKTDDRFIAPLAYLILNQASNLSFGIVLQFHLSIASQPHKGDRSDCHPTVKLVEIAPMISCRGTNIF
jgi:hypothetical protein